MPKHTCWSCGKEMPKEETVPAKGWAIRADNKVAACPDHTEYMPPHPKSERN